MKIRALFAVAVLAVGCKDHHEAPKPAPAKPASKIGTPVARGTIKRASVHTGYGIAVPAGADIAALKKLGPDVAETTLDDFFNDSQMFVATRLLEPGQIDALKASRTVLVVQGSGPDGLALARELAATTNKIAVAAHGWVLDSEALQAYPADKFGEHIPGAHPDIRKLITIHAVSGGTDVPFLDTAGLRRYGLPDLYVAEVAEGQIDAVNSLMNAAAQALLDHGDVDADGNITVDFVKLGWDVSRSEASTGKATFKTRWALERDARPGDEPVVELIPLAGATPQGWAKTTTDCFGEAPDEVLGLKADDPDLLAAEQHARTDLVALRSHFQNGVPYDEHLSVKARFGGADQVEWMWVDVVAYKGNTFSGTLANEPDFIKSLHLGQKVTVKLADVGDYFHQTKDGKLAGGYSVEVLKKHGVKREE